MKSISYSSNKLKEAKMKKMLQVVAMLAIVVSCFTVRAFAKDTMVILTDRSDFHLKNLTKQYSKTHNVNVKVHYVKKGLVAYLRAHKKDIDVVIVKNSSTIILADKLHLLGSIPTYVTNDLPRHNVAKDNTWFNMSYRLRSFIIAKGVTDYPKNYEDLANPKYKGQICIRSFTHDYNIELFGAMLNVMGEQHMKVWLQGLKDNLARTPQGNDRAQAKAIAEGKCKIGIMNTYYMGLLLQNSEQRDWANKINLYIPNQANGGAVSLYSGVGLSISTDNKHAVDFMIYLLDPINQQFMSSINYEYPIIGNSGSKMVQSFGDFQKLKMKDIKILPVPQTDIAAKRKDVLRIINSLE